MEGHAFLKPRTMAIFGMGFIAICLDAVAGVPFGKFTCWLTRGKIDPLTGQRGSPHIRWRPVWSIGRRYDKRNYLLMHAAGANSGGQIGSAVAAAVMLSVLKGMGLI
jgi:carboxybiotin decarboxylase